MGTFTPIITARPAADDLTTLADAVGILARTPDSGRATFAKHLSQLAHTADPDTLRRAVAVLAMQLATSDDNWTDLIYALHAGLKPQPPGDLTPTPADPHPQPGRHLHVVR